jgi:transcriptional regulator with XRE-family HTH domain
MRNKTEDKKMNEAKVIAAISSAVKADSVPKFAETGSKEKETAEERVLRLYKSNGGPLIGWLLDEAKSRRQSCDEMAREIGVSYTYIAQLRNGTRSSVDIRQDMAEGCAKYLGVPPVVVKIVAGSIRLSDFVCAYETEEEMLDRVMRKVQDDPQLRYLLPSNLSQLASPAKKALALMYAETAGHEIFGHRELPTIVRYLQRAAMFHDANEAEAIEEISISL